jgi:hypothetical protein
VRLAVSGLPSGATYKWSSNPVTPKSSGVNSVLTVTTSKVQNGTYTLNISATGSDTAKTTHTTTVSLVIK